jgi:uncharacterized protein involved in exopolysaccharide biosynthesis
MLGQFSSTNTAIDIPNQSKALVESIATLQGKLIAAESELKGLKQIYGEQNVRVTSLEAKIADLRRNLRLIAGDDSGVSDSTGLAYPSIRKLPILGVKYAELLRHVKLSETIFEALTRQYEMAKVQEAKEIPTVRLLDKPSYPEKRYSPARLMIALFGGFLGLIFGFIAVFWKSLPTTDSRKAAVLEVSDELTQDVDKVLRPFRRGGVPRANGELE